ncbi:hypothetical protein CXF95_09860 [Paraglaciecola sp. MB-3u-78]|jgi:hypothetical protein|nr:hypothetical protein CXF95_09860 [Paraglaciecola sp. MB-3u-78]
MKTNYGSTVDNKKNDNKKDTYSSSNQDVNPYWPKAQVLPSAINSRSVQSKPSFSVFFALRKALKSKFIRNDSHAK